VPDFASDVPKEKIAHYSGNSVNLLHVGAIVNRNIRNCSAFNVANGEDRENPALGRMGNR
jgi:hypothetical protein